jgi:hypothetical protein
MICSKLIDDFSPRYEALFAYPPILMQVLVPCMECSMCFVRTEAILCYSRSAYLLSWVLQGGQFHLRTKYLVRSIPTPYIARDRHSKERKLENSTTKSRLPLFSPPH